VPHMHAPLPHHCFDDPMTQAMGAPVDDIMDGFAKRHRAICQRCQEYGAANVEIR
jgi:hypothetical protein